MWGQSSSEWRQLQPPPVPPPGLALICAIPSLSDSQYCSLLYLLHDGEVWEEAPGSFST